MKPIEIKKPPATEAVVELKSWLKRGYLLHGSRKRIDTAIEPRKANDISGASYKNMHGVYAIDGLHTAVAAALLRPKPETKHMTTKWGGNERGFEISGDENVMLGPGYVYVVPVRTFQRHEGEGGVIMNWFLQSQYNLCVRIILTPLYLMSYRT